MGSANEQGAEEEGDGPENNNSHRNTNRPVEWLTVASDEEPTVEISNTQLGETGSQVK